MSRESLRRMLTFGGRRGRNSGRCAGMTLMEIMIVVIIISLLSTLGIYNISRARERSRVKAAEVQLSLLSAAVTQLAWDTGRWPPGIPRNSHVNASNNEHWDLGAASAGLITNAANFPNWKGPYIKSVPKDPWKQPYFFDADYRIAGTNYVVVGSFGPNRVGRNVYDADDVVVKIEGY